jgi:hypothetical protein
MAKSEPKINLTQAPKEVLGKFVNSKKMEFIVCGIPPLMIPRVSNSIKFPDKPTYTVTLATGEKQVFEHDEKSLTTEEDKEAWKKYLDDQKEAETELSQKMLKVILQEGVIVEDDDSRIARWKKRQAIIGLPVSEDIDQLLLDFKQDEVVKNAQDINDLMDQVMSLTGVKKEDLAAARQSFQDTLEPES